MKKFIPLLVALALMATPTLAFAGGGGFDEFGYNDTARIFVGIADGVDRNIDGMVGGDATYANDWLVMKWNAAWDACNDIGGDDPDVCAGAWTNNEWNGNVPGGSDAVWHYKIVWIGPCGANGAPLPDGGYCIWNNYEVLMDQGQDPAYDPGHLWFAHAIPNGYGAQP